MSFDFNFIYNRPEGNETEDSLLALNCVEYLDKKISGWGYGCYIPDRDCIAGRNIFDELFKIVSETEKTLVVITPGFRSNYWAKYSKQAAFKYLLDCEHQYKLIPIALNIDDNKSLRELNVNEPLHIKGLNAGEWESKNKRCFERLKKTLGSSVTQRVVEERGDNRLRTEVQQQLVTKPASETSLSPVTDASYTEDQSFLSVGGDSSTADEDILPEGTSDRSQAVLHGVPAERMPGQTGMMDEVDGSSEQILAISSMDNDRKNDAAGELPTRRNHISISDDNDLSMDTFQLTLLTGAENANDRLESRPETLEASKDVPMLSVRSFEEDESIEVSAGSLDPDQTNPKYIQSESGHTTPSENTPSPDRKVLLQNQTEELQNKTDDDKIFSHDSRLNSETKPATVTSGLCAASNADNEKDSGSSRNDETKQSQDAKSGLGVYMSIVANSIFNSHLAFK